jgi:hypothetical protein
MYDELTIRRWMGREMRELSRERTMVEGKTFVEKTIVFDLLRPYPTAFQIMMR